MRNRLLSFIFYVSTLLFFSAGTFSSLQAQVADPADNGGNCQPAPNCVINGDLIPNGVPTGNMNSSFNNTVPGWYISHGTPSFYPSPFSPAYHAIWMWSYSAQGEGMFTCYNFQRGHRYEICFWVMNTTPITAGNLMVYAANGLVAIPPVGFGAPVPVPAAQQLISNTFVNSPVWTMVTYTFVPNANYNQFWIYPFMAGPPINNVQYSLAVDLIKIHDMSQQTANISINASSTNINWCESVTLCASGSPTGNYYWSDGSTGPCITVSPCETTTYSVTSDPDICLNCESVNSVTIEVNQPDINAFSNSPVRCGGDINLWIDNYFPCASTDWYDPLGNYIGSGPSVNIPGATPAMIGTYKVVISYGNCSITKYVDVDVVDCPCEFRAKFDWQGCNPVNFFSTSSGYAVPVSWFWDFGDGGTSTLQNPTHYYATGGSYTVCVTMIGKSGKETCCDKFCYKIDVCDRGEGPEKNLNEPQGFKEPQPFINPDDARKNTRPAISTSSVKDHITGKAEVSIIPNPATEQAFVSIKNMDNPVVTLMNLNGSTISNAKSQSDGRYLVDLSGLASGVYLVVAEDAGGRVTVKLVKN